MQPNYTLEKIKFATDPQTFERAVALYESGKITEFEEDIRGYCAVVLGTKPYSVFVENHNFALGHCDCYLGQNDVLCKHIVAVAVWAVMRGEKIKPEDKKIFSEPVCSGKLGELKESELKNFKQSITSALKYIKAYNGPSRTWFAYQNFLSEGCSRLSKTVSELPVGLQTAKLLVDLLLRLDKKFCHGGVDDSDGTVGDFMRETVEVLEDYVRLDQDCLKAFLVLKNKETCFGWEESLLKLLD